MAFLYGRAGRLNTKNTGFRPGQERVADMQLMELAQQDIAGYRQSQLLCEAALLVPFTNRGDVLTLAWSACPFNMPAWHEMINYLKQAAKAGHNCDADAWVGLVYTQIGTKAVAEADLAQCKPITASEPDDCELMVNGATAAWTAKQPTAWIEIDLQAACIVSQLRIHWWGGTMARSYRILAMPAAGGQFEVTRSEDGALPQSSSHNTSTVDGWSQRTTRIRIELADGSAFVRADPRQQDELMRGAEKIDSMCVDFTQPSGAVWLARSALDAPVVMDIVPPEGGDRAPWMGLVVPGTDNLVSSKFWYSVEGRVEWHPEYFPSDAAMNMEMICVNRYDGKPCSRWKVCSSLADQRCQFGISEIQVIGPNPNWIDLGTAKGALKAMVDYKLGPASEAQASLPGYSKIPLVDTVCYLQNALDRIY
jgi:hypothetical protein